MVPLESDPCLGFLNGARLAGSVHGGNPRFPHIFRAALAEEAEQDGDGGCRADHGGVAGQAAAPPPNQRQTTGAAAFLGGGVGDGNRFALLVGT